MRNTLKYSLLFLFVIPLIFTIPSCKETLPLFNEDNNHTHYNNGTNILLELGYTENDIEILTDRFSDGFWDFIKQHSILKSELTPFLTHEYFDYHLWNEYIEAVHHYGFRPFEAINNVHEPALIGDHELVNPALFKESSLILVNRHYYLTSHYKNKQLQLIEDLNVVVPGDHERNYLEKTAYLALKELFQAAKQQGLNLFVSSGYRSYERQALIYEELLMLDPANAMYSAKPGHSEHQTGLSVDITSRSVQYDLVPSFEYTPEGQFLKDQAHRFGFIIRYPKGKEAITGYYYEPWHLRYVGKEVAPIIYENNWTLEEYIFYTIPLKKNGN